MTELKSYKPYSRLVTIISAILICIASLDASQVINIFPQFADQINLILGVAGVLAPAISQELRVVRAEELILDDDNVVDLNNVDDEIAKEITELVDENTDGGC